MHELQEQRAVHTPAAGGPLLSVRDLCVRFRGITALDGVSFEVQRGEGFLTHSGERFFSRRRAANREAVVRPGSGALRVRPLYLISTAQLLSRFETVRSAATPEL